MFSLLIKARQVVENCINTFSANVFGALDSYVWRAKIESVCKSGDSILGERWYWFDGWCDG